MTYYYVCDACVHVQPWLDDVDEGPAECENCGNQSQSGPFWTSITAGGNLADSHRIAVFNKTGSRAIPALDNAVVW